MYSRICAQVKLYSTLIRGSIVYEIQEDYYFFPITVWNFCLKSQVVTSHFTVT